LVQVKVVALGVTHRDVEVVMIGDPVIWTVVAGASPTRDSDLRARARWCSSIRTTAARPDPRWRCVRSAPMTASGLECPGDRNAGAIEEVEV
jgi:hypothetical protein